MDPNSMDKENSEDLSLIAGSIVTNALHIPRSLFCPFCADEYMFEFTLKDHLKRKHPGELSQINPFKRLESLQECQSYLCPYCRAMFYFFGLLPKHIAKFHGFNMLEHWLQTNRNIQEPGKEDDLSILYAACSPGLTGIFENFQIGDSSTDSPRPKSILKKTPNKQCNIIRSPSAVSIRRNKSEIVKRSLSVRRELRFDLPPLQKSHEEKKAKKISRFFNIKKLIDIRKIFSKRRSTELPNVVTSTPINFLDEEHVMNMKCGKKSSTKVMLRPLFFKSERYQCAYCTQRYTSNSDLLAHFKEHRKVSKNMLSPRYRCGQCGTTFFLNSYLVRHCQIMHTPQRN